MAKIIKIPHDPTQEDGCWKPREYQRPFWEDFERGISRAICIWARRLGKDETFLKAASVAMHERVGTYWYMLPEAAQARKAIWDAVDENSGRKRIDMAFPDELIAKKRDSDMFLEVKVGSTLQIVGSDNYNSLVGSPPIGVVFSEYALSNPSAFGYLSPILENNGGWAFFNTTPRGPNHAKRMYDMAVNDDRWHASMVTAEQSGIYDDMQLARIKRDYLKLHGDVVGHSLYEQEYLCSFEAAILGAVYGAEMRAAREENRITTVPYDKAHPVETWWDLGYRDSTAIWFIQRIAGKLHAIDYYENSFAGLDHYAEVLQSRGYVYSRHLVPHDAGKGEVGAGASLVDQGAKLGFKLDRQPQSPLVPMINATRPLISRTWFDSENCARGIDCLINYRYGWDETKMIQSPTPVHDWSSHGADAFRTGAYARDGAGTGLRKPKMRIKRI